MLSDDAYHAAYRRFQSKLRQARLDVGLTQVKVASLVGKPQSFVSRAESGERRVDWIELQMLARILQKPLSYFEDETLT